MERLTDKKLKAACGYFVNFASKEEAVKYRMLAESAPKYEEIYRKLADYEDKQEQGLLLELPVQIGTTVFCIDRVLDSVVINEWKFCVPMLCEWGEYVFATRSEAEEALARMGGE